MRLFKIHSMKIEIIIPEGNESKLKLLKALLKKFDFAFSINSKS